MKTGDATVDSMFDEITEVHVKPDGTVEAQLVGGSAEEMENAVGEFVRSWRRWKEIDPAMATSPRPHRHRSGGEPPEWLMLADNRMKDAFCGRDRSKRSIALYQEYKLTLIERQKRLKTDA